MKRHKETRDVILAAAQRLLERGGQEAVTMRRVAKAVGVTAMAIYHHFPDRDALLRALADVEFERIGALFDGWPARGAPVARLRRMAEAYIDYAFGRSRLFAFLFLQDRPGVRRFPADFRDRRSPMLNRVADTVAQAMLAGELRKDDFWEVTVDLWAFVHGHLVLYRAGRFAYSEPEFRAFFRRSLNRFLKGLQLIA
jgi:AcrR family transcriptional regulator